MENAPSAQTVPEGQGVKKIAYTVKGRVLEIGHYGKTTDKAIFLSVNGLKSGGKLLLRKDSEIDEEYLYGHAEELIGREVVACIVESGGNYTVVTLRRTNGEKDLGNVWYRP